MPTVSRYGQPQIQPAALPGVQKRAAETPLSEGAGVQQARADKLGQVGQVAGGFARLGADVYGQMVKDERDRADRVALMEADNQLSTWMNARLYDPQTGALTVKGKDAQPLPEQVHREFGDVTGAIDQGLSTDTQHEQFAALTKSRSVELDLTLRRHVFGEMQRWQAQTVESAVTNNTREAITYAQEPTQSEAKLDAAVEAIRANAKDLGMPPEQVTDQVAKVTSNVRAGVVEQLLASEDTTPAAQIYFEAFKGQIDPEPRAQLTKALELGGVRKQAQDAVATIQAAGGTLQEQRAKADAIDNRAVRDEAKARLEHEAAVTETATRQEDEQLLTGAYATLDATKDLSKIAPTTLTRLAQHVPALRLYLDYLLKGKPIPTNPVTYYALMEEAGTDPTSFSQKNLGAYRPYLDDTDWKQIVGLQLSVRQGNRKQADDALDGFRTGGQIFTDSLTQYGVDPHAKETTAAGKAVAALHRLFDEQTRGLVAKPGTKAWGQDAQDILDRMLSVSPQTQPSTITRLLGAIGFKLPPTLKALKDVTIDDVPPARRTIIEQELRAAGRPVSDETVLDLYLDLSLSGPK